MMKKRHYNLFYLNIVLVVFLIAMIIIGGIFVLYTIMIPLPNGEWGLSNWPQKNTFEMLNHIVLNQEGIIELSEEGTGLIESNHLWMQIFDENGNLLLSKNAPEDIRKEYDSFSILKLSMEKYDNQYIDLRTAYIGDRAIICLIGYPIKLSQITMYVNQEHFSVGKNMVLSVLLTGLFTSILIASIYNLWMSRNFQTVILAIESILHRSYKKLKFTGVFAEINHSLNVLQSQIVERDNMREKDERQKEEWIANITHDLKTPLSPIRGYAELLKDSMALEDEKVRRYGRIIYKNSIYTEQLIEEMKLTYQLKNGMLPLKRVETNMVQFVKEIIIDILNNPEYENQIIDFYSDQEDAFVHVDQSLLKRAFMNLIMNSMIHNKEDVKIGIYIFIEEVLCIEITDNGRGIEEKDLECLFTRYYRGTNTNVQSAGTGLGLAIAKEIIELNGGSIRAERIDAGSKFTVSFHNKDRGKAYES